MTADRTRNVETFLARFFGDGNDVKLEQVMSGEGGAGKFLPWVERLTTNDLPLSTVLLYKTTGPRAPIYTWYGVAGSERELRGLREELTAFVGPTWSTFRGQRAQLDPRDPIEAAVLDFTGGAAVKFSGDTKRIWDSLERMRSLWEKRKVINPEVVRPVGRVLRDFYMALQAGNRETAEGALRYLRDKHGYDALNLLFLRVQLLAQFERWEELLDPTHLPDLLQVRRPPAVTQALLRAVYRRELIAFEERRDPAGAVAVFRDKVLPRYGSLFAVRAGDRSPEAAKSFMMLAVSGIPPKPELRDELLNLTDLPDTDQHYLQQIAALLPVTTPTQPADSLEAAKRAMFEGDFDHAFNLALEAPPSVNQVRLLVECAYELQTLESERAALKAFFLLPEDQQQTVRAFRLHREFIESLTGAKEGAIEEAPRAAESVPGNWVEWLERLYEEPDWSRAVDVARQGSTEWTVSDLRSNAGDVRQLAQQLNNPPAGADTILHNSLPFLLAFFQRDDEWPRREFLNIYGTLLDLLVISTSGGDDDLTLFNELVETHLTLGVDEDKYVELLQYASDLWGRYASPAKLDWILDLIDSLVLYPCPANQERVNLLSFVANKLPPFARRVETGQWEFLQILTRDLRQQSALQGLIDEYSTRVVEPGHASADPLLELAGKSVTIYTLTEAVAKRVKDILEGICSRVTVHLSHDKVGSERLKQLAQNSDYFLMATASAKHAATGFIEDHRPNHLPLLRPAGKGSASMLRALRLHLEPAVTS